MNQKELDPTGVKIPGLGIATHLERGDARGLRLLLSRGPIALMDRGFRFRRCGALETPVRSLMRQLLSRLRRI